MIEHLEVEERPIPLSNVTGVVLHKVIEYCEYHKNDPEDLVMYGDEEEDKERLEQRKLEMAEWDKRYIGNEQDMIFELILAANYMDIKPLLDLGCRTIASMIRGKTPAEIREIFRITNDFSAEEMAEIDKENEWAEDLRCEPGEIPLNCSALPLALLPLALLPLYRRFPSSSFSPFVHYSGEDVFPHPYIQ